MAKILGIDEDLGTLQAGKQATFFVSSGDALDMRTNQVFLAWVMGRPLNLDDTQKQLFRKYTAKYNAQ